jgi:hypothetical protein
MNIVWEKSIQEKFDQMIAKIPPFLRPIAQAKVSKKAEALAQKENRQEISEKDMVDAFFMETPFGFHGPMKTDMQQLGIDYLRYGYEK